MQRFCLDLPGHFQRIGPLPRLSTLMLRSLLNCWYFLGRIPFLSSIILLHFAMSIFFLELNFIIALCLFLVPGFFLTRSFTGFIGLLFLIVDLRPFIDFNFSQALHLLHDMYLFLVFRSFTDFGPFNAFSPFPGLDGCLTVYLFLDLFLSSH